jgi:hypothetical protein
VCGSPDWVSSAPLMGVGAVRRIRTAPIQQTSTRQTRPGLLPGEACPRYDVDAVLRGSAYARKILRMTLRCPTLERRVTASAPRILVKGGPAGALKVRSGGRLSPYLHLNIHGQLLGLDSLRQYACGDAVTVCRQRGVGRCFTLPVCLTPSSARHAGGR